MDNKKSIDLSGLAVFKEENDKAYQPVGNYATEQQLTGKVDKVIGKGLSTNDYTNAEKQKVADALTQHQDISGKADVAALNAEVQRAQAAETTLRKSVQTNTADIEELQNFYEALTQTAIIPVAAADWPLPGLQERTIYRVAGQTSYTDYMYNGTTIIPMATYDNAIDNVPTKNSDNLVKSGGVATALNTIKDGISEITRTEPASENEEIVIATDDNKEITRISASTSDDVDEVVEFKSEFGLIFAKIGQVNGKKGIFAASFFDMQGNPIGSSVEITIDTDNDVLIIQGRKYKMIPYIETN